jgi:hypothetical protein
MELNIAYSCKRESGRVWIGSSRRCSSDRSQRAAETQRETEARERSVHSLSFWLSLKHPRKNHPFVLSLSVRPFGWYSAGMTRNTTNNVQHELEEQLLFLGGTGVPMGGWGASKNNKCDDAAAAVR